MISVESANANNIVFDDVSFLLSLAETNMKHLLDPSKWSGMNDLFEASVKYANSKTVREWADLLYENNQKNTIEIRSDGLSDQKGTKTDIRVLIDGKKCNINISLKVGDVKQFGQVAGADFDKQHSLWHGLFGIDVSPIKQKFVITQSKSVSDSLIMMYEYVSDTFNKKMKQKTEKEYLLKKLGEGIDYHATRNENEVELVQLSGSDAKIYKFNNIYLQIASLPLISKIVLSSNQTPKMIISDKSKTLLEVRVKQENKPNGEKYVRNYIEKGHLLTDLISSNA